jgi:TatD DNase family protein
MRLIDTHAHLNFDDLQEDFDGVLQRAREAGVERIVTIGASSGLDSNQAALKIAGEHDSIRCSVGIHPHSADDATDENLSHIRTWAEDPRVVGIGESGLDYFYDNAEVDNQKESFRWHLQLSKELDKPIIIHSRDADEDTIELLKETGVTGGILHCFTGSRWMAEELFELDFYISFSGIVTFGGSDTLRSIAEDVPADRILFETDAPFLAPEPHRGKTNEPALVRHTAEVLADVRGVQPEELADQVWNNARRVFNWD